MKKILFAMWLLVLCTVCAKADFRVWSTVRLTNAPAQSNTITIGTNVLTWRTNITNSASWVLITNTAGGSATNLRSQLLSFPITNVTVVDITNSTYLVLVGAINSNLVVTTVGNYATVSYYTSAVYSAFTAAYPFTKESDPMRTLYMNSVLTSINAYATSPLSATGAAMVNFMNTSTNRQTVTNKAGVNFDFLSGKIGSAEVTNLDFFPKWQVGDREDIGGSGGAELTFLSYDGASWLTIKPNAFTGAPMLLGADGQFYDLIDNLTEGIETNSTLANLGTIWRWFPKLGTYEFLGVQHTNRWGTYQYYTNANGEGAFATYAIGYDVFHEGRFNASGGGVITNLDSVSGTNGNFNTLSAGTATMQDATISQLNAGAGNYTNPVTRGSILFSSKLRYGVTNFTSLIAGVNPGVVFGSNSLVRITGLTGDASISGVAGGLIGDTYLVLNDSAYNVGFVQSVGDPVPANRFSNYGGRDEQIPPGGWGLISYEGASSRWKTVYTYPSTAIATNAAGTLNQAMTNLAAWPGDTNSVGFRVRGLNGQSTNVAEFMNTNGNVGTAIGPNGGVHIGGASQAGASNLVVDGDTTFRGSVYGAIEDPSKTLTGIAYPVSGSTFSTPFGGIATFTTAEGGLVVPDNYVPVMSVNFTNAATANDTSGVVQNNATGGIRGNRSLGFKTLHTCYLYSNMAYGFGFVAGSPFLSPSLFLLVTNTPPTNVIMFKASSDVDTTWKFLSSDDGINFTSTDTGVAVAGAGPTRTEFEIRFFGATSNAVGYINGIPVATNTSHLPMTNLFFKPFAGFRTLNGVNNSNRLEYIQIKMSRFP